MTSDESLGKANLMPNAQCSTERKTSGGGGGTSGKRQNCHAFSWVEPGLDAAVVLPSSGAVKSDILPGEPETVRDICGWGNSTV